MRLKRDNRPGIFIVPEEFEPTESFLDLVQELRKLRGIAFHTLWVDQGRIYINERPHWERKWVSVTDARKMVKEFHSARVYKP